MVLETPAEIILELGRLGRWVQAIGLIVVLWIVIQAVTLYFNRKRRKILESIDERLKRVESKLDEFGKRRR